MKYLLAGLCVPCALWAQAESRDIKAVLERQLIAPEAVAIDLQRFLAPHISYPTPGPQWKTESVRLRREVLAKIVTHGWPSEWFSAPLKFVDAGTVHTDGTYNLTKFRIEIIPGMWMPALLYSPAKTAGRVPGVLNVNGHVGPPGKAIEYKQKRCIQLARMGTYALNLEWFSFGELAHAENQHWFGAHLDLAGANGVGIFYLAMRRGLDFLAQHDSVNPQQLAVTGLSGGGWQTIFLSSLDERVAVSIPVAGYAGLEARLERGEDVGDIEQNPTDLLTIADYPHLTAMRAPKPTQLIYNAEDDCCFRAPLVRDQIYTKILGFFNRDTTVFGWHENRDPGNHNYQLDNRMAAYAFLTKHLGLKAIEKESNTAAEVKTAEELSCGLEAGNLTLLSLARKMAERRNEVNQKPTLKDIVRYQPVSVKRAWAVSSTKTKGVETVSYRFDFTDGLSATGVLVRAIDAPTDAPLRIVLDDRGRKASGDAIAASVNRGERVLAIDILGTGEMSSRPTSFVGFAQLLAATGHRALGIRAAHLAAVAAWQGTSAYLETYGMRSQLTGSVAAALQPKVFRDVQSHDGLTSLAEVFSRPVHFEQAPEMFCLDLYRYFDLKDLESLRRP